MKEFVIDVNDKKAGTKFNKNDEVSRLNLAQQIIDYADNDESTKGDLRPVWDETTSHYYTVSPERLITGHMASPSKMPVPVLSSRVDAIVNYITGAITNAYPYFVGNASGDDYKKVNQAEAMVQWALDRDGFPAKARLSAWQAVMFNRSYFYVTFGATPKSMPDALEGSAPVSGDPEFAECGVRVKVIHAKDFIAYPNNCESLSECVFVGFKADRTLRQIRALMDQGYFIEQELEESTNAGEDFQKEIDAGGPSISYEDTVDEPVKTIIGLAKLDLDKKGSSSWWEVEVLESSRQTLRVVPYTYHRPCFFAPTILQPYGEILTSDSVARRILPAHKMIQEAVNLQLDGMMVTTFPMQFYNKDKGLPLEVNSYSPGQLVGCEGLPEFVSFVSQFNPSMTAAIIDMGNTLATQAGSIPDTGTGTQYNANSTAAAVNATESSKDVSVNAYLSMYAGSELGEMAEYVRHLCYENYDLLYGVYGAALPCKSQDDLDVKTHFTVNGRNAGSSPQSQLAGIDAIMERLKSVDMSNPVERALLKAFVRATNVSNEQEVMNELEQLEQQITEQLAAQEQMQSGMGDMAQGMPPGIDPGVDPSAGAMPGGLDEFAGY
jgi:hypothetical protein